MDTRYRGSLPNSSLSEEVTNGGSPNPNAYMLKPSVAWKAEQLRSWIIEGEPILYDVALAAGNYLSIRDEGR